MSRILRKFVRKIYFSYSRNLPEGLRQIVDRVVMNLRIGIPISQIPERCLEAINSQVEAFSIPLFVDVIENGYPETYAIGSGTLIRIGNHIGILTAEHVAREIDKEGYLGLILKKDAHHYSRPVETMEIIEVGRPDPADEYSGPDLAVIFLPNEYEHEIDTYKSFYPIDCNIEDFDAFIESRNEIPWVIWGMIGAETQEEEPEAGFERVRAAYSYSFICALDKYLDEDTFDYVDISVDYASQGHVPPSFRGISGGGIWSVKLVIDNPEDIAPKDLQLMGVAYYQTKRVGDYREIRGHGLKSIIKGLCDL